MIKHIQKIPKLPITNFQKNTKYRKNYITAADSRQNMRMREAVSGIRRQAPECFNAEDGVIM